VIAGGRYLNGDELLKVPDYRTERRRVLTFAIGGKDALPTSSHAPEPYQAAPGFRVHPALAKAGAGTYVGNCAVCHGFGAMSGGTAPHLLRSSIPLDRSAFIAVVRDGGLLANGMPAYPELTDAQIDGLLHYLRQRARDELAKPSATKTAQ
jgi:quinohemoprotein ethanol dehydrogenase